MDFTRISPEPGSLFYIIIVYRLVFLAVIILVFKWLGAWMFGIDKVIKQQREILEELKQIKDEIKK